MNRKQQINLAKGNKKNGGALEYAAQFFDYHKTIEMLKKNLLPPASRIDDDAEAERAYRFYGGGKK